MPRFMTRLGHPATVVAALALFVALGSGAYAAAQSISGSTIKNNSIAEIKLTKAAITALSASTLTYNATAVSGSPAPTPIGTVLGDTFGATCTTSAGDADFALYVKTLDGSWSFDAAYTAEIDEASSSNASSLAVPAATLSSFTQVAGVTANAPNNTGDVHYDIVQLKPLPGSLIWHEHVVTTSAPSHTCHFSLQAVPSTVTAHVGAAPRFSRSTTHLPIRLGPH